MELIHNKHDMHEHCCNLGKKRVCKQVWISPTLEDLKVSEITKNAIGFGDDGGEESNTAGS
jgi:hypothetical protein